MQRRHWILSLLALMTATGCLGGSLDDAPSGAAADQAAEPVVDAAESPREVPFAKVPSLARPLGDVADIGIAVLRVEGTVTETHGPPVTVNGQDFVDYELGVAGRYPSVVVEIDGSVLELTRSNTLDDRMRGVRAALVEGAHVELMHANGKFEIGRRYALFVGPWEPELGIIFFAFDIEDDQPAPGFRNGYRELRERAAVAANSIGFSFETDLELFTELADTMPLDLAEDEYVGLAGAIFGNAEPPGERASRDVAVEHAKIWYPIDASDAVDDEHERLTVLEIFLSGLNSGGYYGLQGPERRLGWFGANRNGTTIISGYVDPSESYEIIYSADGTTFETIGGLTIGVGAEQEFFGVGEVGAEGLLLFDRFDDPAAAAEHALKN